MNEIEAKQTALVNPVGRYVDFVEYIDATPKTLETYGRALKQMAAFFDANGITQPCREDVIAFRDSLKARGLKPATIQLYITAARLFFQWLEQSGIYRNVASHIKGAKLDRAHKKDALTSHQVKKILKGISRDTTQGKRDYAILALMITGGLRTVEVARADVGDLRTVGDTAVLFIQGKGREEKADYVKLDVHVEDAIRQYLAARGKPTQGDPLFVSTSNNHKGQRMTTRAISGLVKSHMVEAGLNSDRLTAHSLRHTAVTLSLLEGKPLEEVQQFARHSSISTTMIYNHALDKARNSCGAAIAGVVFC